MWTNTTQFEVNSVLHKTATNFPYTLPFLPFGLLILLLAPIGIVANLLNVFILCSPRMKSSYITLLLGLTFCDIVFLMGKLLRYGIQSLFTDLAIARGYTHVFYPCIGPALKAITSTAQTGYTYFTMAVAADRYIVICWPFQARRYWSIKSTNYLTAGVIIFAIVYNLPRWWEYKTLKIVQNNETYYQMNYTDIRNNINYRVTCKIIGVVVMHLIPYLFLAFTNASICYTIRTSQIKRGSLTTVQRKDKSFSLMLISIVLVFVACSSVSLATDTMEIFHIPFSKFWKNTLANFLNTLNSSVNFILYCLFGSRFRKEFIRIYKESCCTVYRCTLWRLTKNGSVNISTSTELDGLKSDDAS